MNKPKNKYSRKDEIPSTKQLWWRRRFIIEGNLIGVYSNLQRMLKLPELTDDEKTNIKAALIHMSDFLDRTSVKSGREKSWNYWKTYCY